MLLNLANPIMMYSYGIEPDSVEYQLIKSTKFKELQKYKPDTYEDDKVKRLTTWLDSYIKRINIDQKGEQKLTDELRLFFKYPISPYAHNNLLNLDYMSLSRYEYMNKLNPKFILRNHVAQRAIEKAEKGDYSELSKVLEIMLSPFDEHSEVTFEGEYDTSTLLAYNICVSCSS
jgi:uncharacterized protein YdiU (UPF0061 family)